VTGYAECGERWGVGHVCRKPPDHVNDPLDDEHDCCCGANSFALDGERDQ